MTSKNTTIAEETKPLVLEGLDDGLKAKVAGLYNNYVVAGSDTTAKDRFASDLAVVVESYEELKAELDALLHPPINEIDPPPTRRK